MLSLLALIWYESIGPKKDMHMREGKEWDGDINIIKRIG